jgi:DNA repair exonuclease SbcCD ATPase subunit
MKIIKFKAENIKKLVAVEITPEGNTVVVTGKNGAGKSSVLDAIYWALSGTKSIQEKPIRDGEDKAFIRLDLGSLIVERRFTEKNTYLYVSTAEGAKFSNPQEILDKLIGSITFDPLEFSRMPQKKQYEMLRNLVKLDVDIDELDALNKADYEERTFVNREVKELEAQIKGLVVPEDAPSELIDISAESEKLIEMKNRAALRDQKIMQELRAATDVAALEKSLEEARKILVMAQKELEDIRAKAEKPEEIDALRIKISSAADLNRLAQTRKVKEEKEKELAAKVQKADALTQAMEEREQQKKGALEKAKLPVAGLSLSDGGVIFNGIPFDQCSSAEQLRVSTAMAMASNPELRVIRIKDGSLLDSEGMEILKAMAELGDFQIWIERVGDSDPMAVLIEDGSVAA